MSSIGKIICMVGLDGYAPSTSSMSMRHSTIELKALKINLNYDSFLENIFVFFSIEYNKDKFTQNSVRL